MRKHVTLAILSLAAVAAGCDVQLAKTRRRNLESQELRSFVLGRQNLTDNKIFFWKEPLSHRDVARATFNSREVDRFEDLRGELVAPIEALRRRVVELEEPVAPVRARLAEIAARLADTQNPPSEEEKAQLLAERTEKEAQLAPVDREIAARVADREKLELQQNELAERMVQSGLEIARAMETAPCPKKFRVSPNAADGTVTIRLDKVWEESRLDEAGTGFDKIETEPFAQVRDVRYQELGGKLDFAIDVFADEDKTQLVETLTFKLHRLRYKTTDTDGRVIYGGDVEKTLADGTVRKGTAKFKTEL